MAVLLIGQLGGVLVLSALGSRLSVVDAVIAAFTASALVAAAAWVISARVMERWMPTEATLRAVRANALMNALPDGIIGADSQLRIVLFNEGAERIFGFRSSEVIGRDLEVLFPQWTRLSS